MSTQDSEEARLRARVAELTSRLGDLEAERLNDQSRERQLRTALDHATDGVVVVDSSGRVVYANRTFAKDLGADPDKLPGTRASGLERDPGTYRSQEIKQALAEKGELRFRYQSTDAEGSLRTREASYVAIPDDESGFSGTVAVIRDVTNEARLEAQLSRSQRLEALGRLAGGVAHDFNNLLTVISGLGEILIEELPPGSEHSEAAGEIRDAAERASALTRQLLAFSSREVRHPRVLDLNAVIRNLDGLLRRVIGENVDLSMGLEASSCQVLADLSQMDQIVMNLVLNARDAISGAGEIVIATRICEGTIKLEVRDNGEGMSADTQRQVFDPFFTTKELGWGTGLGLSSVYGIVQQSGGEIEVRSELGAGSTFEITLPRIEGPSQKLTSEKPVDPSNAPLSGTILVVDDERSVARVTAKTLRRFGLRVVEATSGEEALDLLKGASEPIDLVLADVVMPGIGGLELRARIEELGLPVATLLMSGYAVLPGAGDTDSASDKPNGPFLRKPFAAMELRRAVVRAMNLDADHESADES